MRKVKKVVVVPLLRNGRPLSDSRQKDEDRYLQLLLMYTHFVLISAYNHLVCMYVCMYVCSMYLNECMYGFTTSLCTYVRMYVNTIGCIGSGRSRSTSSPSLSPVTSLSRSRTSPSFSRSSSQTLSAPEPIIGDKNRHTHTYIHTYINTYKKNKEI